MKLTDAHAGLFIPPQNLGQSYTPVNGWRDVLHLDSSSDPSDPPLPPVWDWSLQYSKQKQDRFTQPVPPTPPLQPLLNGNLNTNPDTHRVGPLLLLHDASHPLVVDLVKTESEAGVLSLQL